MFRHFSSRAMIPSVVSDWKTESSGFHRPLLKPAQIDDVSSAEIETSGNLRVLCLGYTGMLQNFPANLP